MPFNGSGTFVPLSPPDFPALPFTTILASQFNNNLNDIITNGLTDCMTRDGQSPPTANIPMAGFRLTGLGAATQPTDAAQLQQTLATLGQVGVIDWNTRITNGIFEGTAASLVSPATNFPPTTQLGELIVIAQGALVTQIYVIQNNSYKRQKVAGVWSGWSYQKVVSDNGWINGAFQVWQAGVSLASGTGLRYIADMWPNNSVGTTYTASQQSFVLGQTDVPPSSTFFHRTTVTTSVGAANFCFLQTLKENVKSFSGQTVTVSFYAKASSALPVALELSQYFGTGGSPSANVNTFVSKITLSTTWARYQATVLVPSLTGKTLGTSGTDGLTLQLWYDAGSNFNSRTGSLGQQSGIFDVFGFKIEQDFTATDYIVPLRASELPLCYRYYAVVGDATFTPIIFSGNITTSGTYLSSTDFPVTMWGVPTVTLASQLSAGFAAGLTQAQTAYGVVSSAIANATGVGFYKLSYIADARF